MDTGQFVDVTVISVYRSFVDTGQFGDVTVISSTCIWIQVTCGYRSICCNQVKRITSPGSDHKVVITR